MTDTTEQKAMVRVNGVLTERGWSPHLTFSRHECSRTEALCRTIEELEAEKAARAADREQHEAFRQEVSDAVEERFKGFEAQYGVLYRFIIAKPVDPLVEMVMEVEMVDEDLAVETAEAYRAAAKARGYEWRKIEGEG